ncbi:hypothetical protein B0J13DRAFT_532629 [Dactylonectria estremocensis]|uniref:Uncharacterized protein n=1 Tax=Dactylonectria estremocensis TaxID=1079267 RepID=A0A9P9DGF8_9HYPO|nr:hypothetical protein B0J13DRAFT_532629 [Dactylonectria estremocensis]
MALPQYTTADLATAMRANPGLCLNGWDKLLADPVDDLNTTLSDLTARKFLSTATIDSATVNGDPRPILSAPLPATHPFHVLSRSPRWLYLGIPCRVPPASQHGFHRHKRRRHNNRPLQPHGRDPLYTLADGFYLVYTAPLSNVTASVLDGSSPGLRVFQHMTEDYLFGLSMPLPIATVADLQGNVLPVGDAIQGSMVPVLAEYIQTVGLLLSLIDHYEAWDIPSASPWCRGKAVRKPFCSCG